MQAGPVTPAEAAAKFPEFDFFPQGLVGRKSFQAYFLAGLFFRYH